MKQGICVFLLVLGAVSAAHADEFNVQCTVAHTLADDPIVYPGKPGQAMVHDFFGNTSANANSTYESLNANKVTSCDSVVDISSYWAPQLKRSSGIIKPIYQKTYYKNDQPVVPVQTIPPGLQMLAGNHMGTGPNVHIEFLCSGTGKYSNTMPTSCPFSGPGGTSQLDISVHFPDCWDGKSLKPNLGKSAKERMKNLMKAASGGLNVGYRNSDGTCPAAYPAKIPELQMNLAYDLGTDGNLSDAQLSLDPVLQNGQWVPQWGSMYTAHGDFINAWHAETLQYLVDTCMNKIGTPGLPCDKSIPIYYSAASANVQLDSKGVAQPASATMVSEPNAITFLKFPMPAHLDDYPYKTSALQTLAGNITDSSAITIELYAASTGWDSAGNLPTAAACDKTKHIGSIFLNNVQQVRANDISSYFASQKSAGATQIGICIVNTAKTYTVSFSSRQGSWTPGLYLK